MAAKNVFSSGVNLFISFSKISLLITLLIPSHQIDNLITSRPDSAILSATSVIGIISLDINHIKIDDQFDIISEILEKESLYKTSFVLYIFKKSFILLSLN
jgi:hypothetical protein